MVDHGASIKYSNKNEDRIENYRHTELEKKSKGLKTIMTGIPCVNLELG